MPEQEMPADVTVWSHGGIFRFRPKTEQARSWLEAHVQTEPWQWQEGVLAVDGQERGQAIVMALLDAGLQVGDAFRQTQQWTADGKRVH